MISPQWGLKDNYNRKEVITMKIKLFSSSNNSILENDVNAFLKNIEVEVIDIKFSSDNNYSNVMVIYNDKSED